MLVCTGAAMTNHALGRELLQSLRERGCDGLREISSHWFRTAPANFFEGLRRARLQRPRASDDRCAAKPDRYGLPASAGAHRGTDAGDLRPHDAGRTLDHAQTLLAGIRNSRLATMDGSGHSPMVETPEAFDTALHAFLATLPQPARIKEGSPC